MKYLLVALTALFVAMAYTPTVNAAGCPGGVYNASCIAGAYDVVVVRRRPALVVRRPAIVGRRPVVVR
jgi:hypothetical protein